MLDVSLQFLNVLTSSWTLHYVSPLVEKLELYDFTALLYVLQFDLIKFPCKVIALVINPFILSKFNFQL